MDLITQLPESNGYNAICVIVDRLIKRAYFIISFHPRIWCSYYMTKFTLCIDCHYKSFQIEEYNTQPSYSKNGAKF